jgi:hypothetical protein
MIRTILPVGFLFLASLAGCSLTSPASDEIARESAETNALIEAANRRLENSAVDNSLVGGPLPPLQGVHVAAPASNQAGNEAEHHDHHPE